MSRIALRALFPLLVLAACTESPVRDSAVSEDSAVLDPDGGVVILDSGAPPVDSGMPPIDSGQPPGSDAAVDSGVIPDSGPMPDAGPPMGTPLFVVVGDEGWIVTTPDGMNWRTARPPTGQNADLLRNVGYGSGRFYAVGGVNDDAVLLISEDGVTWTPANERVTPWMSGAAWLPGGIVVIAGGVGGRWWSSDDGTTFRNGNFYYDGHFRSMTAGNGRAVAVGHTFGGAELGLSSTTVNGMTWTPEVTGGATMQDVEYGNGLFVAVGVAGRASVSTDGINWTTTTIPNVNDLYSVAYGDGLFVTSGNGRVISSTDGVNWNEFVTTAPVHMAFLGGVWVGVDFNGRGYRSTNGIDWTETRAQGGPARHMTAGYIYR